MLDFALGELGVGPDAFWHPDFTWNDLDRASRGYHLRQIRAWERTRQLGEWTAAFNGVDLPKELAKQGRTRLLALPTDTTPTAPVATQESASDFLARMAANNFFRSAHGNA